jgi:hypothetical protein
MVVTRELAAGRDTATADEVLRKLSATLAAWDLAALED